MIAPNTKEAASEAIYRVTFTGIFSHKFL